MPAGNRAVRVPSNLRIVVSMQIDEAGRDDQPVGIDDFFREARGTAADLRDLAILDEKIALKARNSGSVDDRSAFDLNVVFGH